MSVLEKVLCHYRIQVDRAMVVETAAVGTAVAQLVVVAMVAKVAAVLV